MQKNIKYIYTSSLPIVEDLHYIYCIITNLIIVAI